MTKFDKALKFVSQEIGKWENCDHISKMVETLSAAKATKKDGKGNIYADMINHHMPLLDAMQTASRKAFRRAFSC